MYLGQVKISADIIIIGNDKEIKIGLIPIIKRPFAKIIREINKNDKFNNKNADCHPSPKTTLHKAIKNTGNEKKNKCGLYAALSIE